MTHTVLQQTPWLLWHTPEKKVSSSNSVSLGWMYLGYAVSYLSATSSMHCSRVQVGSYCLIFPHEGAESVSIFCLPHPLECAASCALQWPGDSYLPPELRSARKLATEAGKEAGWLTLQLLETKQ